MGLFLLQQHDPANAAASAQLAISTPSLLWDAETELLGGSHLDLARRVCHHAALPSTLLEAFNPQGNPGSLPDLLFRATATAERHGFEDPDHPIVPPALRPNRERILDMFFRNSGSSTAGVFLHISAMLADTPLRGIANAA
ncbi:MAG: hypothetical protein HOH95_01030 [Dehalococcoidia bacterium]|nr:hypothetical protein [Dehalococcoidia bacterium]